MKTLFIIFLLLSVITLGFSIFATVGQVNLSRKFTGKTTGTVSHWDYDDDMFSLHIWFPVIKFTVNGTEYKTNIPFTRVKTIKDPKMYPGQFTASGNSNPSSITAAVWIMMSFMRNINAVRRLTSSMIRTIPTRVTLSGQPAILFWSCSGALPFSTSP